MSQELFQNIETMERDIQAFVGMIIGEIKLDFQESGSDIRKWILSQLDILDKLHGIDETMLKILDPIKRDIKSNEVSDWKILTLIDIKCVENFVIKTIRKLLGDNSNELIDFVVVSRQQLHNLETSIEHTKNEMLLDVDMEVVEDIEEIILKVVNRTLSENKIEHTFCDQYDTSKWVKAQKELFRKITEAQVHMSENIKEFIREYLTQITAIINDIQNNESRLNSDLYKNADLQLKKLKQLTA